MSKNSKRRERILDLLSKAPAPVPGEDLGGRFEVSRAAICQDIAVLRAEGHRIAATPRGYVLERGTATGFSEVVAVRHGREDTESELNALVDAGVTVADVVVEHPVYGELRGNLQLRGRDEVASFMEKLSSGAVELLSALTGGVHMHTLWAADPARLERARDKLRALGVLLEREPRARVRSALPARRRARGAVG
jgi:transcriptional regulator of NAD metabolism